jgi:hypothetical protein
MKLLRLLPNRLFLMVARRITPVPNPRPVGLDAEDKAER